MCVGVGWDEGGSGGGVEVCVTGIELASLHDFRFRGQ